MGQDTITVDRTAAEAQTHGSRTRARTSVGNPRLKRTLDVAVSATVLLVSVPIMVVVALAIVLESRGPVFYHAERIGRGGRRFRMLKFRKMADDAGGIRLTTGADKRLTRVGALLTKSKLDELPQFFNVLRGDMSLIGPRPEDESFVSQREEDFAEIHRVRPGITGYSQIAFAAESEILCSDDPLGHYLSTILPQKCGLDRLYVRSAGVGTDMRILGWTIVAVLLRREVAVHRESGAMNLRRRPA